mgnify:CR=1 FL=1
MKAEGSLGVVAEKLLEENRTREKNPGPDSVAQSFVGTDGIMMKVTTMDGFMLYDKLEGKGTVLQTSSYAAIA